MSIETKISDERTKILQSLAERATTILKFVELERAGVHAENIPGKCPINNTSLIYDFGGEITALAGELSACIFREEHPAEYAQKLAKEKADWERRFEQWHNSKPGDDNFLFLDNDEIEAIRAARAKHVANGILADSGRRDDDGEVIWKITEAGKAYVETLESLRD